MLMGKIFLISQTTWCTFYRSSSNEAKARLQTLFFIQREKGWSKKCKKVPLTPANQRALKHFDQYYSFTFGPASWSGIRAAMLTPPAKVAVLNFINPGILESVEKFISMNYLDLFKELRKQRLSSLEETDPSSLPHCANSMEPTLFRRFLMQQDGPSDQLSEFLPPTEFISERDVYTRDSDKAFEVRADEDLVIQVADLPLVKEEKTKSDLMESFKNLKCFALPCGTFSALPRPNFSYGSLDFYPLDLGSVLTVLMLDLEPSTRLLDLCSAPGGKAVTALQTLNLEQILCTDVSASRLERLRKVLTDFACGVGKDRKGLPDVEVATLSSLRQLHYGKKFSRILVDVPCSTDRDALTSPPGGYFAQGKAAARINLSEKQKALLRQAMSFCEVGGYVVYSTCTLSTAQNQAVIEFCLSSQICGNDDKGAAFAVVDPTSFIDLCTSQLSPSIGVKVVPTYSGTGEPLGAIVIPCLAANYGPTFICKLKRLK